jgi:hypothetical protein
MTIFVQDDSGSSHGGLDGLVQMLRIAALMPRYYRGSFDWDEGKAFSADGLEESGEVGGWTVYAGREDVDLVSEVAGDGIGLIDAGADAGADEVVKGVDGEAEDFGEVGAGLG